MNGHVASLIELGAGFHPDMSGREIYILMHQYSGSREEKLKRESILLLIFLS